MYRAILDTNYLVFKRIKINYHDLKTVFDHIKERENESLVRIFCINTAVGSKGG